MAAAAPLHECLMCVGDCNVEQNTEGYSMVAYLNTKYCAYVELQRLLEYKLLLFKYVNVFKKKNVNMSENLMHENKFYSFLN